MSDEKDRTQCPRTASSSGCGSLPVVDSYERRGQEQMTNERCQKYREACRRYI